MNTKDCATVALLLLLFKKECDLKTKEKQLKECKATLKNNQCVYTRYIRCK